ncbi:hypothetical protein BAUCODRAFT_137770 [Baudoinia panamericana UAMH 10762]|uniref:Major facilitator superfamily (MFS) profile domain-containing protein n=1 Tax=Baudoinia panamericana (strain UAMH 10762) TaxID=717646 RepID=M2NFC7_BAUPA|nr:uncharacterized protein BAUCODRAFT_137770 [Baudoinia panamericana UAMH 10762]EMC97949.1 hypothetical protein BAUCODRAFT_137770 [Baudoinia panamericana UAMH 10762]
MCIFASFAGLLFGYDSGYIASVLGMTEFKHTYGDVNTGTYTTSEKSLIVAILSCGTFFGALISATLADRFGRRTIIIAGCVVFVVGVTVQLAQTTITALVIGRLIAGLGVGFVSVTNILYLSEISPRNVRGAIVSCYQFAITIGIMLASCVGYATSKRTDTAAFRIPISIQFFFATVLIIGLLMLPESPRFFVKQGRLDKAMKALARVRGQSWESEYVLHELAEIQANYEYEKQLGEVTWLGCFSGGVMKSNSNARKVFIGTAIQMFQQFTGINFIFYYNTTFFQQVGIQNAFLISMITTIVNVVSTPVSFYTIERLGRRPLLIYGALAMVVCEFVVAIVGTVLPNSNTANYVLIVFVCLYVFFFASTWGPAAWVLIGEIFQLPIRSKGVALSTASNWFWNCIIAVITPYMVEGTNNPDGTNLSNGLGVKVFFVWGALCFACVIFAYFCVPETKGLTLEQVDRMMEEVSARRSGAWRARENWARNLSDAAAA